VAAREAILGGPADEAATGAWMVARWLWYWLTQAEPRLRPSTASTLHGYRDHIDRYLIPSLGRITLADLTGKRLQACFDLLARQRTRKGTPIAASTVDQVRAALRAALNAAVREAWTDERSRHGDGTASACRSPSGRSGRWSRA
jgi:hypothetical protein